MKTNFFNPSDAMGLSLHYFNHQSLYDASYEDYYWRAHLMSSWPEDRWAVLTQSGYFVNLGYLTEFDFLDGQSNFGVSIGEISLKLNSEAKMVSGNVIIDL